MLWPTTQGLVCIRKGDGVQYISAFAHQPAAAVMFSATARPLGTLHVLTSSSLFPTVISG